ncbi:hypothetical protein PDJAM_G00000230 [Pangasius djambal]|uniref:Uncharacterized protein n=1 Tax=Pangasius djambal TaxID=1691987 RepID=A0ACC5XXK2_9TELE|nr:hypothetical protein [Pangasius djambal]
MAEATNPAATSFPAPTISLPLGLDVIRTYSGALICMEIVSVCSPVGGKMAEATNPAATSFPAPTMSLPLGLDVIRTYSGALICMEIDMMYHFVALLFYFAAFVLEAATTSGAYKQHVNSTACVLRPSANIITFMDFRQYSINVAATIFAFVVTVCYGCSMFMGFKRWRK